MYMSHIDDLNTGPFHHLLSRNEIKINILSASIALTQIKANSTSNIKKDVIPVVKYFSFLEIMHL